MKTYQTKDRQDCQILHFCDGDTVFCRVRCSNCGISKELYVRLKGIESHEPSGPTKQLAKSVAQKWNYKLAGAKAELICTQSSSDRYGRVVGALFIDGVSLASLLVMAGDAWYHNHIEKT